MPTPGPSTSHRGSCQLFATAAAAGFVLAGCFPSAPSPTSPSGSDSTATGGSPTSGGATAVETLPPPRTVALLRIVRSGDAVPDQAGATFTYFGNPVIDQDGRVAFYAAYSGGSGNGGLYVWQAGSLERIYDTDPNHATGVPALGPADTFGRLNIRWDIGSPHLAWGNSGRLLFAAHLNGISQPNTLFRWRARDGDLFLVSDAEIVRTAVPDSTADFLPEFYHPEVSDQGLAVFASRYSYFRQDGTFALFEQGIFTTDGRNTQGVALGAVPDQPAGATFSGTPVLITSQNAAGDVLFQAAYQNGQGDRGVYLLHQGEVVRVIDNDPNRALPGLPDGAQVGAAGQDFQAVALGPNGDIAIDTTLTVGGTTRDTVLLWDGSRWHELQSDNGRFATDLLAGVNSAGQTVYLADGRPFLGDGQTATDLAAALPAELAGVNVQWEPFGAALSNQGRVLLRYQRTAGETPGLVLWTGAGLLLVLDATQPQGLDSIDVIFPAQQREAADVDRAGTISNRPEVNRPGLSGAINDRDEWVFRAGALGPDGRPNTADDQQAVFLGRGQ